MCNCNYCKDYRKVKIVCKNGSHRQKNKLINELFELYVMTASHLDYEKAIADGTWPNAKDILEQRLRTVLLQENQISK